MGEEHAKRMDAAPRGDKSRSRDPALLALGLVALVCAALQGVAIGFDSGPLVGGLALGSIALLGAVTWLADELAGEHWLPALGTAGQLAALAGFGLIALPVLVIGWDTLQGDWHPVGVDAFEIAASAATIVGLAASAAGFWLGERRRGGSGWGALGWLLFALLAALMFGCAVWAMLLFS